ncbi:MAG: tail protein X [Lentisphaeria bacterium]|nr:tail protein X [Lentisphaeria bacterium]
MHILPHGINIILPDIHCTT